MKHLVISLLAVLFVCAPAGCGKGVPAAPTGSGNVPVAAPTKEDDSNFEKLDEPKPGEWLYVYHEKEQSFDDYAAELENKKTASRNKIYVIPLGSIIDTRADVLKKTVEYAKIFFNCEGAVGKTLELPGEAWHAKRRQYDGGPLLDLLRHRVPENAIAVMGLLNEDLFVNEMNFVFGVASFNRRVSVHSLCRYDMTYEGQPASETFLKRALKVATHEMGHIFGMPHCTVYKCLMNGSNSLPEADRGPMHLCPNCSAKLRYNVEFDPAKRYEALAEFYSKNGFEAEAVFAKKMALKYAGK